MEWFLLVLKQHSAGPRISNPKENNFLVHAQRSWETICNNFVVRWKFMGIHLLNVFYISKSYIFVLALEALGENWR